MAFEVIIGIGIPLISVGIFILRYLWKKEKCFILLEQKIDSLIISERKSHNTHEKLYNEIDKHQINLMIIDTKMDLIIKHLDIKYTK